MHVLVGVWLLLMIQIADLDVKRPTLLRFRLKKLLKFRYRPDFIKALGMEADGYMRKKLRK